MVIVVYYDHDVRLQSWLYKTSDNVDGLGTITVCRVFMESINYTSKSVQLKIMSGYFIAIL